MLRVRDFKIILCALRVGLIFILTIDNANSNNVTLGLLKWCRVEANKTVYYGECLHVRSATYILNLIVSDGLKYVNLSATQVRYAVKFVRSSPSRL